VDFSTGKPDNWVKFNEDLRFQFGSVFDEIDQNRLIFQNVVDHVVAECEAMKSLSIKI
jgi:hypothetical protein